METILYNIFKTTSAMTLPETILESSYKVLQIHKKERPLNDLSNFQRLFNCTLLLKLIVITFLLL